MISDRKGFRTTEAFFADGCKGQMEADEWKCEELKERTIFILVVSIHSFSRPSSIWPIDRPIDRSEQTDKHH